MTTDLYAVLQIPKTATPEDVRNAYRQRALATHPDRLPPTATEEERRRSTDMFRQVNNAYEVLNNKETRREYDLHGVWPPPEAPPQYQRSRDPFSHPFFQNSGFGFGPLFDNIPGQNRRQPSRGFTFTDPFELFDQFFPDVHTSRRRGHLSVDPVERNLFGGTFAGLRDHMRTMHQDMNNMHRNFISFNAGGAGAGNDRWVSSSQRTVTVNGVTYSQSTHRDAQGNIHVKDVGPDGREVYTINGVPRDSIESSSNRDRMRIEDQPRRVYNRHSGSSRDSTSHSRKSHDRHIDEKPRHRSSRHRDHDPYDYY